MITRIPRIILLIAIHFFVSERNKLFLFALQSIVNNTVSPDHVYISYSTDVQINEEEWTDILHSKNIKHNIFRSRERKLQFEHYNHVLQYIEDLDLISFLDSDDLLDSRKFEWVQKNYNKIIDPKTHTISHKVLLFNNDLSSVPDYINKHTSISAITEHVSFLFYGILFKNWFKEYYNKYIIKNSLSIDLLFCVFIEISCIIDKTDDILYYYRKHNGCISRSIEYDSSLKICKKD